MPDELSPEEEVFTAFAPGPRSGLEPPSVLARRLAAGGLAAADALCAALTPGWVREAPGLIVLALHSLCARRSQVHDRALAPNQNVCVDDLRSLVEHVLETGHALVSPEQVDAGLAPGGRYAMLTFDDGYFNNVLALDVLDEFEVPAAFFVSTTHVVEGKAYWWDAASRELARAGASSQARNAELRRLKDLSPAGVEASLRQRFGAGVLRPRGDADRPFTPAELADFARHRWVHIGNHTADHAILTRCTRDEMVRQIRVCQDTLRSITGRSPQAIAYPNGNHSKAVLEAAAAAGLRVGLTVRPTRNSLPLRDGQMLQLGRFYFHGRPDPRREFQACRSGFVPSRLVRSMLQAA